MPTKPIRKRTKLPFVAPLTRRNRLRLVHLTNAQVAPGDVGAEPTATGSARRRLADAAAVIRHPFFDEAAEVGMGFSLTAGLHSMFGGRKLCGRKGARLVLGRTGQTGSRTKPGPFRRILSSPHECVPVRTPPLPVLASPLHTILLEFMPGDTIVAKHCSDLKIPIERDLQASLQIRIDRVKLAGCCPISEQLGRIRVRISR